MRSQVILSKLTDLDPGYARVIADRAVWRRGDLFKIEGLASLATLTEAHRFLMEGW